MAARQVQLSSAEVHAGSYLGSVDEGVGTVTRDVRIVFGGGSHMYFDLYARHASAAETVDNVSTIAPTAGGTLTGVARINFNDALGPDQLFQAIDRIWQGIAIRGNAEGWWATTTERDETLDAIRMMSDVFKSRWRAEGQIGANSTTP